MKCYEKNICSIYFSDSHKNISFKSVDRKRVLTRNVITRNIVKSTLSVTCILVFKGAMLATTNRFVLAGVKKVKNDLF